MLLLIEAHDIWKVTIFYANPDLPVGCRYEWPVQVIPEIDDIFQRD